MLSISKMWGCRVYKQWSNSAQSLCSYTAAGFTKFACVLIDALTTSKPLDIPNPFHHQRMVFVPVLTLVVPTIHKTYYNNNYLNKYNSNNRKD
jgi:hypothetical protein